MWFVASIKQAKYELNERLWQLENKLCFSTIFFLLLLLLLLSSIQYLPHPHCECTLFTGGGGRGAKHFSRPLIINIGPQASALLAFNVCRRAHTYMAGTLILILLQNYTQGRLQKNL